MAPQCLPSSLTLQCLPFVFVLWCLASGKCAAPAAEEQLKLHYGFPCTSPEGLGLCCLYSGPAPFGEVYLQHAWYHGLFCHSGCLPCRQRLLHMYIMRT